MNDECYEVTALLTTVTGDYDRTSMHGVRRVLLAEQAREIGLPLEEVVISADGGAEEYETQMREVLTRQQQAGVVAVAIGDIFLEDLRKYREDKLAQIGLRGVFPIWLEDTRDLSRRFIDLGFHAIVTCVDTEMLDASFSGRDYDEKFLADLPASVDPCGENGEFHSFVWDGPIFAAPVGFTRGEGVLRDGRWQFTDLVPAN
jgi:uncharacterized protein (TIGR00290 family)